MDKDRWVLQGLQELPHCGLLTDCPPAECSCSFVPAADQHVGGGGGGGGDQPGGGGDDGVVCAPHRVSTPLLGPAAPLPPEIGN